MITFIAYIIEANIAVILLYAYYAYIFDKFTYYTWNRYYLLFLLFFSLLLPLLKIDIQALRENPSLLFPSSELVVSSGTSGNYLITQTGFFQQLQSIVYGNLLNPVYYGVLGLYLLGLSLNLYLFVKKIIKINKATLLATIHIVENHKVFVIESHITAFSFLKKIFVNKQFLNLSKAEQGVIVKHELTHTVLHHTIDILIYETTALLFWFNPVIRKIGTAIKTNHEYMVDFALTGTKEKKHYSSLLLKLVPATAYKKAAFTGKKSQLMLRLNQLLSGESEKVLKLRFVSGLPVLIFCITAFIFLSSAGKAMLGQTADNKKFRFPVHSGYVLVAGYFENKIVRYAEQPDVAYKISHYETTVSIPENTKVYAFAEGKISNIIKKDNFGITEYELHVIHSNMLTTVYSGLAEVVVKQNQVVSTNTIIAKSGDTRFYTAVNFKLLNNGKPVDLLNYLN